jgi:hypothetical protein
MDLIVGDALVLLVWFNQINKTNQTNQINEIDQMNKSQRGRWGTWCSSPIVSERTPGTAP